MIQPVAKFLSVQVRRGQKRKWIALGSGGANLGFNSSGLAGAMNAGEKCIDPPIVKGKKSTPKMLQVILEDCDSALKAVEKLQQLIKDAVRISLPA